MVAAYEQITVGRTRRTSVVSGFRFVGAEYRPGLEIAPHFHERSNVTIVLRGSIEERAGSRVESCGPGSVVVKPAGTVHSNRVGRDGASTFVLELPAAPFPGDLGPALPISYQWRHGGRLAGSMLRLLALVTRDASGQDAAAFDEELLTLTSLLPDHQRKMSDRQPPTWLLRVCDALHACVASPVCVRDIAAAVGVHPVYLARVFRRFHATSIVGYVHRLRVRQAAGRLTNSDVTLAEVAMETGFADQAHFCRVFKAQMGVTPGQFRRATRLG